ncbi:MAG TPA: hypothetical protein VMU41_14325 [Candidatus Binataceae bacterium]|nr:hypothetical protein [Candidatus Binataceae bacterium]
MSEEYRNLLVAAYPELHWPTVTRGTREAIKIADGVRRNTPFLTTLVGGDQRGMLRRACLMWRIQSLCKSKELPFEADEVTNTNGTSHLLRIRSKKIELHIVRTEEAGAFPVEAPIRQDNRASNSADLFHEGKLLPLHEVMESVPRLYGWLMWGATGRGELTHLALGMPEPEENKWLTYIDVLAHVTALEATPGAATTEATSSKPNPAMMLKFREEFARAVGQDNFEQDAASNDE